MLVTCSDGTTEHYDDEPFAQGVPSDDEMLAMLSVT